MHGNGSVNIFEQEGNLRKWEGACKQLQHRRNYLNEAPICHSLLCCLPYDQPPCPYTNNTPLPPTTAAQPQHSLSTAMLLSHAPQHWSRKPSKWRCSKPAVYLDNLKHSSNREQNAHTHTPTPMTPADCNSLSRSKGTGACVVSSTNHCSRNGSLRWLLRPNCFPC